MKKIISIFTIIALCVMMFPVMIFADDTAPEDPARAAYEDAYQRHYGDKGIQPSPSNLVNRAMIYVSVPNGVNAASLGLTETCGNGYYNVGCYDTYGTLPWGSQIGYYNINNTADINALLYNSTLTRGEFEACNRTLSFYNQEFDINRVTLTTLGSAQAVYTKVGENIYTDGSRATLLLGVANKFKVTVNYPDGTSNVNYYTIGEAIPTLNSLTVPSNTDTEHFAFWEIKDAAGNVIQNLPGTMPAYDITINAVTAEHTWDEGTVTTNPTCTQVGVRTFTCAFDGCDEIKTADEDIIDHISEPDDAVDATCTVGGLTAGSHCSRCQTVLVEQEETDPLGHDLVVDEEVPATCISTGLTEGSHCSRCNEVLVSQQTIPMLVHEDNDHDGVCDLCDDELEAINYLITQGANSECTVVRGSVMTFTSNAEFDRFVCVKVDGNIISASNYTALEGSTKITLTTAYLNTLAIGRHSLEIVSSDGSASTFFTIKKNEEADPTPTEAPTPIPTPTTLPKEDATTTTTPTPTATTTSASETVSTGEGNGNTNSLGVIIIMLAGVIIISRSYMNKKSKYEL